MAVSAGVDVVDVAVVEAAGTPEASAVGVMLLRPTAPAAKPRLVAAVAASRRGDPISHASLAAAPPLPVSVPAQRDGIGIAR
jgi:hypothetical protein